jgi:putative colanic acid biosynthesis UDP-glucose lipid carrier transferase
MKLGLDYCWPSSACCVRADHAARRLGDQPRARPGDSSSSAHGYNHRLLLSTFRTMRVTEDGPIVVQAKKDDDRITRIGSSALPSTTSCRSSSMCSGDVLGGPRPHAVAHNQHYRERLERYANRHCVKPGMTGWAQINGFRGPTEDPDKMRRRVEMDLYYIENWSLWLDLKIIALTPFLGFVNRNAF